PTRLGANRIAQVERRIHDLLDADQHRDHCDEANGVAVRLGDAAVDPVHRPSFQAVVVAAARAAFSSCSDSSSAAVTGLSQTYPRHTYAVGIAPICERS